MKRGYRAIAAMVMTVGLVGVPMGCNIVAPAAYLIGGPGNVDRVYELPKDKSVVIFVDDPANRVTQRRYRGMIADTAQELLLKKKVLADGKVIDGRSAIAIASQASASDPMSIREIGEAVRADSVVYAVVTEYSLTTDPANPAPSAVMRVKVVDVATGDRVWPAEAEGFPLRVAMEATPDMIAQNRQDAARVESALAVKAGTALAQMFYKVEITESARRP